MGPLTFTMYILPLGQIIRKHDLLFHIFADDSQIYTSYDPKNVNDSVGAIHKIQNCILNIQNWMTRNRLKFEYRQTRIFRHWFCSCSSITI